MMAPLLDGRLILFLRGSMQRAPAVSISEIEICTTGKQ